jgi:CHAT domain-containing protein
MSKMYDSVLRQKFMVASSVADQRAKLAASNDPQASGLLSQLMSKRNRLAVLYPQLANNLEFENELRNLGVHGVHILGPRSEINQLQQETDDLEKELSTRSSSFKAEGKPVQSGWQQVRAALKKDEAAVEFVRFLVHDGKNWTGATYYVALVLTPAAALRPLGSANLKSTSEIPAVVLLGEARDLEARPMEDYRRLVLMKGLSASEYGLAFYRAFWKPPESKLAGAKRVYGSPDGVLNQVSWAPIPNDHGHLLSEKYDVNVVLSTKDLLRERHGASNSFAVLIGNPRFDLGEAEYRAAVAALQGNAAAESSCANLDEQTLASGPADGGDSKNVVLRVAATSDSTGEQGKRLEPLTETQKEMKSLSDLFKKKGWRVEGYCRQNALEEAIKRVNSPRVLHVATHGFFRPDQQWAIREGIEDQLTGLEDPMLRSGLYFAGADRTLVGDAPIEGVDNGVLTAYEATGLNLQGTELVVLSACETGLGRVENGEGAFGLRRALQEAGAQAVLMSMWPVPDRETEELMTLFYEKWLSGMDKHQALHEAQVELRKELQLRWQVDQPPPHFWAAFVLVGR